MKLAVLSGGMLVALVSCYSLQDVATPKPTPKMAELSGKPYGALKEGYEVYMERCSQCHEHHLPSSATLPGYHKKVSSMATRAGLTKAQEKSLQLYLDEFVDR